MTQRLPTMDPETKLYLTTLRVRARELCHRLGHMRGDYDTCSLMTIDLDGLPFSGSLAHELAMAGSLRGPRGALHTKVAHLTGIARGEHEMSALAIELLVLKNVLSPLRYQDVRSQLFVFAYVNGNALPYSIPQVIEERVALRMCNLRIKEHAYELLAALVDGAAT